MVDNIYKKDDGNENPPERKLRPRRARIGENRAIPVDVAHRAMGGSGGSIPPSGGSGGGTGGFSETDVIDIKLLDSFLRVHAYDDNSFKMCGELINKNRDYSPYLRHKLKMDTRNFDSRKGPNALREACEAMRQKIVRVILEDFRHNPTEEKRIAYNDILKAHGRKIEKIPNVKTDYNVHLVVRAAFEGEFSTPTLISTNSGQGYSHGYVKFADPHGNNTSGLIAGGKLPENYDWESNPAIQAMSLSENMSKLIPDLKATIKNQHIPQEVIDGMTISDVAHILYKGKNGGQTPVANQKIQFSSLNEECDEGARIKFWKEFGKDKEKMANLRAVLESRGVCKEYINDLFEQIRERGTTTLDISKYDGPHPKLSVHHKMYVQDAAFLGKDAIKIDDLENFAAVVDFPNEQNHEGFEHAVDTIRDNDAFRLVNLRDTEKETVYLQVGTESYTTPRRSDYTDRKTYRDFAVDREGGR